MTRALQAAAGLPGLLLAGLLLAAQPLAAQGVRDARFFGEYCGSHQERVTTRVTFLGITLSETTETHTFAVRARLGYLESGRRVGLVQGGGTVRRDDVVIPIAVAGTVTRRGVLTGTVSARQLGVAEGEAHLSDDGNRLTILGLGRRIRLDKAACGNTPPRVRLESPAAGEVPWGQELELRASVSDAEDSALAPQRLVWVSDRDGRLGEGALLRTNFLSHGLHKLTFSAADSGGLTTAATVTLRIADNPPNRPRILSPPDGAPQYAGAGIVFRGVASDRESGSLFAESLRWASDLSGELGTGELLVRGLPEGRHTVTLTARDEAGGEASAAVSFEVLPPPPGGLPPTVVIRAPRNFTGMADHDCLTLVATATDPEDGRLAGAALTWVDSYRNLAGAEVRTTLPATGERVEFCSPATTGHDTVHTVTVTATDGDGLTASDSIRLYVIPGGLI